MPEPRMPWRVCWRLTLRSDIGRVFDYGFFDFDFLILYFDFCVLIIVITRGHSFITSKEKERLFFQKHTHMCVLVQIAGQPPNLYCVACSTSSTVLTPG